MTTDHAEPMLPVNERSEPLTPFEAGHAAAFANEPYGSKAIPAKHRASYARGYSRGCIARAKHNRDAQEGR